MSVANSGLPQIHLLAPRDIRDPFGLASWSVGATGDVSAGRVTLTARLLNPNFVVWPTHAGASYGSTSSDIAAAIRAYEIYPGLGAGVSRNLELPQVFSPRVQPSQAERTFNPAVWLTNPIPWWVVTAPDSTFDLLDVQYTANVNGLGYGLSMLCALFDVRCLQYGGPRNPLQLP